MAPNLLSADPLASLIASSLPKDADPQLKAPEEAIAIACHAAFLSVGFKFIGLSDKQRIEPAFTSDDPKPLPPQWNAHSTTEFAYTHPQSSITFVLKISSLGNKTVVNAIGIEHNKVFTLDISTDDYTSKSSLPASPTKSAASLEDAKHTILGLYISPSRLTDLGTTLRVHIIQNLIPSLQKEGYEETRQGTSTSTDSQQGDQGPPSDPRDPAYQPPPLRPLPDGGPARPHPLADPSVGPRRPPMPAGEFPPPGFEDPYDINRGPRGGMPGMLGGAGVPGYGERDLFPPGMGPNDPLRIGGGRGGGGGMYMDFDDMDPTRGGGGLGGMRAPPGARYDPPGGFGEAPFDPLMGDGQRRGPPGGGGFGGGGPRFGGAGGAPPNPFGGFGSGDFI